MPQDADNDGWIEVKPKVRTIKTTEQKEQYSIAEMNHKDMMQRYQDDMRRPAPPPKEQKNTRRVPVSKKEVKRDEEDDIIKIKTISIGQRIKLQKMRNGKGLTREELAKKVNVVVRIVADYENGRGTFDPSTYSRMVNVLDKLPDVEKKSDSD